MTDRLRSQASSPSREDCPSRWTAKRSAESQPAAPNLKSTKRLRKPDSTPYSRSDRTDDFRGSQLSTKRAAVDGSTVARSSERLFGETCSERRRRGLRPAPSFY